MPSAFSLCEEFTNEAAAEMSGQGRAATAIAVPAIDIPSSTSTVDVRLLNTTASRKTVASELFNPPVSGFGTIQLPSHSFLITHNPTGEHVLFDLAIRKDWQTGFPPVFTPLVTTHPGASAPKFDISVLTDVPSIFTTDHTLGITPWSISAVVWSHHHLDHRGNISLFPSTTKLVIGLDLLDAYKNELYPTNVDGELSESDFMGREVWELDETDFKLTIGGFPAHDYFDDGSFYLLSAPGHTAGHLAALAHVTNGPATFVLLAGDCAHHPGVFRPSSYLPLPAQIDLKSGKGTGKQVYSGAMIASLVHPQQAGDRPFLLPDEEPMCFDTHRAAQTVAYLQSFDANEDVLVCIAHDNTLLEALPVFPDTLNDWKSRRLKEELHWLFLGDFDLEGCEYESCR